MDTDVSPRSGSQAPAPRKARRGFNLIEAAIVLGVVGLVIGGIWVAANAVNENRRANETALGLLHILDGVRNIYKGKDFGLSVWTSSDITEFVFTAGLVPRDWGKMHWSGAYNQNFPYPGAGIGVRLVREADGEKIALRITGLSTNSCNRLIQFVGARITSQSRLDNIGIVDSTNNTVASYTYPVNITTVNCPADVVRIGFIFYR